MNIFCNHTLCEILQIFRTYYNCCYIVQVQVHVCPNCKVPDPCALSEALNTIIMYMNTVNVCAVVVEKTLSPKTSELLCTNAHLYVVNFSLHLAYLDESLHSHSLEAIE